MKKGTTMEMQIKIGALALAIFTINHQFSTASAATTIDPARRQIRLRRELRLDELAR
jgi:hypothetical protein